MSEQMILLTYKLTTMTDKEHIEEVIKRTFDVIKEVYKFQKEGDAKPIVASRSRIIFPKKREEDDEKDNKKKSVIRVSEQELRFIFVEQLNKYLQPSEEGKDWDVYYSVETPTKKEYGFSNPDNKESGNIDLVIHDSKLNRIALIEFKAKNPRRQSYQKDFEKLTNEPSAPYRYFIQLVVNTNSGTVPNIINEKVEVKDEMENRWGDDSVHFICHSLASKEPIIDRVLNKKNTSPD